MIAALYVALLSLPSARVIEVELIPSGRPQLAIWLEDEGGRFVDTIMVTRLIGSYGLGNRPGRPDFGTGYAWPYGKRESALPIWAHRRGVTYDRLVFQDCKERAIRYHNPISSVDRFYCRPTTPAEHAVDAISCPTSRFDSCKGMPLRLIDRNTSADCAELLDTLPLLSNYPPRNDLLEVREGYDWPGVAEFARINDLDAVSTATPPANMIYHAVYTLPEALAPGVYHLWVEASAEGDFNEHTEQTFFPDPIEPGFGVPFLGQPSIVWRVKIDVREDSASAATTDYLAYAAQDGSDGDLRDPDVTITTGVPGSGAERLLPLSDGARVQVRFDPAAACEVPAELGELRVEPASATSLSVSFAAVDSASTYDVRYSERSIADDASFSQAIRAAVPRPNDAGRVELVIDQLQPDTKYSVAVRAHSACGRGSTIAATELFTPARESPAVDACFIATAAYGSKDQGSVRALRGFRDRVLMKSELGRDFVEVYYELSPGIADLIREHEAARQWVRAALDPLAAGARLCEAR